jgi:putative tricarboxylic transport membrane protein
LIGVLPGIGPLATIAMLLPLTFNVPPVAALIMLAGIYYGAQYGGSTTAILVNLPGEASAVVTCSTATRWRARAAPARRWRSRDRLVHRRHRRHAADRRSPARRWPRWR